MRRDVRERRKRQRQRGKKRERERRGRKKKRRVSWSVRARHSKTLTTRFHVEPEFNAIDAVYGDDDVRRRIRIRPAGVHKIFLKRIIVSDNNFSRVIEQRLVGPCND